MPTMPTQVTREVHCTDGVAWLKAQTPLPPTHALLTSMPDVSELGGASLEAWKAWFVDAATACLNAVSENNVALFYQTDIKKQGTWVDKAYLVQRAAEACGSALLWHKVVCRVQSGHATFGRPGYAHLLCFSKKLRTDPGSSTPDVIPKLGPMTWARAMGLEPCRAMVRFAAKHANATTIVDPFCGVGTALAVANGLGLHAVGVELSNKRAAKARNLQLPSPD